MNIYQGWVFWAFKYQRHSYCDFIGVVPIYWMLIYFIQWNGKCWAKEKTTRELVFAGKILMNYLGKFQLCDGSFTHISCDTHGYTVFFSSGPKLASSTLACGCYCFCLASISWFCVLSSSFSLRLVSAEVYVGMCVCEWVIGCQQRECCATFPWRI